MIAGMRVVVNQFAREVRDEWKVERNPIPKRRRRWRVVKHHIDRPGAYILGDHTICMHPDLYAALLPELSSTASGNVEQARGQIKPQGAGHE